jgi:antitoxin VapB
MGRCTRYLRYDLHEGSILALHIRNRHAEERVRHLAEMKKVGITEAITLAVENEIKRAPLYERIRPIQERIKARGSTGLTADKAFYDSLNDE